MPQGDEKKADPNDVCTAADLDIRNQLTELKAKFEANAEAQKQSFATLEDRIKLRQELSALREEVHGKFRFFQWSAAAVAVGATLVASIGLKSVNDYVTALRSELTAKLDHVATYYSDFTRGVALMNMGGTGPANSLLYFRRCFDQDHYDEAVLTAYLNAIDNVDDWETARDVMRILEEQPSRMNSIKNAAVWGMLASLQIQTGVDDPAVFVEGQKNLKRFDLLLDAQDNEMLRQSQFLHWMAALVDRKFDVARASIEKIATLSPSVKIDSWEKIRNYRFTKRLIAKGVRESEIEKMIMPLKDRFKSE